MNVISARTKDFYDRHVVQLIIEKYGMTEMDAIRGFIASQTYQMLIDPETELYKVSPRIIFDLWETEQVVGDPRQSRYIREE